MTSPSTNDSSENSSGETGATPHDIPKVPRALKELHELAGERGYRLERNEFVGPYLSWTDGLTREGLRSSTRNRLWATIKQELGYEPFRRTWADLFPPLRAFHASGPRSSGSYRPYPQTQIGPFAPPLGKLPRFMGDMKHDLSEDSRGFHEEIERARAERVEQAELWARDARENGSVASLDSKRKGLRESISQICAGVEEGALREIRSTMKVWLAEAERAMLNGHPGATGLSRMTTYWTNRIKGQESTPKRGIFFHLHSYTSNFWKSLSHGNASMEQIEYEAAQLLPRPGVPDALARSTGDLSLYLYEHNVLPSTRKARELDDKRLVYEEALLRVQTDPTSIEDETGRNLPYADESMLTSAESTFRSGAKWHKWGRFIVNRHIELERRDVTTRKEMADEIREALRERHSEEINEAGHDLVNFGSKQLKRVMDHHENVGFEKP